MNNSIAFFGTPEDILSKETKILETGFGEGAFLNSLYTNEHLLKQNIFGVEYSESFFNIAKNKFKDINLFNQDFLSFEERDFDIIIGNPPYISSKKLEANMKEKAKELTGFNETNLYYSFILKSIELLKENGELIYLLPYDFFYNTFAYNLRNTMVEQGYFEYIIDLKDLNIFNGASPDVIIFKWIKSKERKTIKVFSLENKASFNEGIEFLKLCLFEQKDNPLFSFREIEQFKLNQNFNLSNLNFLNKTFVLKDLSNISVGIVSGAEDCFKISDDDIKTLSFNEKKYIKPFIKNRNLFENTLLHTENFIFFKQNEFVNEDDFKNKAPSLFNLFLTKKDFLTNRFIPKNKWWFDYLAIRNLSIIESNNNKYRLIEPNITRKANRWFSVTNRPGYISGAVLMITADTEDKIFFLFGILNSLSFSDYYRKSGPKKGNRILFTQKTLENLILPELDEKTFKLIVLKIKEQIILNKFNFDEIDKLIEPFFKF